MTKPEVVVEFTLRVVVKPEMLDGSGTDGIAGTKAGAVLTGHGEGDQEAEVIVESYNGQPWSVSLWYNSR